MTDNHYPEPEPSSRPPRLASVQPAFVAWLTLVWVALWGEVSVGNILAGAAIAVVVLFVFPLPPLRMKLRIRPLRLAWLVLHFFVSVFVASVQVAWTTVKFTTVPRNAVVEVDLLTDSDFVLTIVAEMTSLVPGSIVLEANRTTHSLFIHVLDVHDVADVEKMRRDTLALERRVVLALGAEIEHLEPAGPHSGGRFAS